MYMYLHNQVDCVVSSAWDLVAPQVDVLSISCLKILKKQILIASLIYFSLSKDNSPFKLETVDMCRHTVSFKI